MVGNELLLTILNYDGKYLLQETRIYHNPNPPSKFMNISRLEILYGGVIKQSEKVLMEA